MAPRSAPALVGAGVLCVLVAGVSLGSALAGTVQSGGTLRIATPLDFSSIDPAVAPPALAPLWYATCATLTAFPDSAGRSGLIAVPEAAAGPPVVSRDRRTYVFTVRRGLRFSDGSPINAGNFARALGRVRNPAMGSAGARIFSDVKDVSATGLRLRIELTRPSGDLTTRLALGWACPVPLGFPADPAGVDLMVGSGPYYVARFVPDGMAVLERNRFYRGTRPQHVDRVVVTIGGDINQDIKAVEDGRADVLGVQIPSLLRPGLARRYGVNRTQLFALPADTSALVFNTSRPLFRDNVALRKAINYAVDRAEVVQATPGGFLSRTPTDQILPSFLPGRRDYRLYPLAGPDLTLARQLAQGNLRGGQAVLWTHSFGAIYPGEAQVIVNNLTKIGLNVQVKVMSPAVLDAKAGIPGAPYDMILSGFPLDYPDPANALVRFLAGENARRPAGNENLAYFDDPVYNQRLAAADRLTGSARFRAFSKLDADIMRTEAPWAPLYDTSGWVFVSKRVGCLKAHPWFMFDFAAMCVR